MTTIATYVADLAAKLPADQWQVRQVDVTRLEEDELAELKHPPLAAWSVGDAVGFQGGTLHVLCRAEDGYYEHDYESGDDLPHFADLDELLAHSAKMWTETE